MTGILVRDLGTDMLTVIAGEGIEGD